MLIAVVLVWAGNQTIGKIVMREMTPEVYTTIRFSWAAPMLFLVLKWREGKLAFDKQALPRLILVGIVGIAFYQTVFIAAVKYASVTNLALMMGISPIFTVILGALTGQERFNLKVFGGCLLAFGGLSLVLLYAPVQTSYTGVTEFGDAIALGASLLWGLYPILVKPLLRHHSGLWVTAWSSIPGVVGLLLYSGHDLLMMDWGNLGQFIWFSLFYAAIPVTVFGLAGWYYGVEKIGANQVMVYMYLIPPSAIAVGYLFLDEKVSLLQISGGLIAMLGLYFVKRSAR